MSTTITLPEHYGLVILCNVCAPFIAGAYMGGKVMAARKLHNVQYPNLYATPGHHDKANEFNNIQRGHQNMFETAIFYIPMSIIAGVQHPLAVAFGGICYSLGCVTYQSGYEKSPDSRNKGLGPVKYIGLLTSLIVSVKFAFTML